MSKDKNTEKKVMEVDGKSIETPKKETETAFEISDKDIAEFKAWKESKKKTTTITCDVAEDDKIYRMWKEESKMVKGIFRCREPIGGSVHFFFRKYKWDKTTEYKMQDGETYEVPLGVARHLNANCCYEEHSHILGSDGNPTLNKNKTVSRMNFENTDFAVA